MTNPTPGTHQKALSINLDDKIYGTIAEIGAGQEVAGWFFRVGAAAGSVAKAISAYDMQVSDEIYGQSERYVSRVRLDAMLDKEYELVTTRLGEKRGGDTRFFAFCDAVAARNFAGTNECQGWVGLRYCSERGGDPNTIVMHINMLDDTNVAQQQAVGTLGVNLIYSAFFATGDPQHVLSSLIDDLGPVAVKSTWLMYPDPRLLTVIPPESALPWCKTIWQKLCCSVATVSSIHQRNFFASAQQS